MEQVKSAFHDADIDTDTDSPDTLIHPYVRHARFPLEDVGVGVVECGLYRMRLRLSTKSKQDRSSSALCVRDDTIRNV